MNKKQLKAVEVAQRIIDNPNREQFEKREQVFGVLILAVNLSIDSGELIEMWRDLYKEAEK